MTRLKIPILAIVAVLLLGLAGLTFMTVGGDANGESYLTRYVHAAASKIHGGHYSGHYSMGTPHDDMAKLVETLQLTPEQHRHMERIHELMEAQHHGDGPGSMADLHEKLLAQCADGEVETTDLHAVIDAHLEQVRGNLYAITDEVAGLVKELDPKQRQALQDFLRGRASQSAS